MSHETRPLVATAVERVPVDLAMVLVATVVTDLSLVLLPPGPARFVLAVPLLFVLPGYALVAGLFPTRSTVLDADLGWVERVALSLPVSLGVLAATGLALASVGATLAASTVAAALSTVTLWGVFVAVVRRSQVPRERRFDISTGTLLDGVRTLPNRLGSGVEAGATLALAGAVVVAAVSVGAAVAAPPAAAGHDSLHVLTEGANGDLVAAGYPDTLTQGESTTLVVGVDNDFDRERSYTVVVLLERTAGDRVVDRIELDRLSATVGPGERWTRRHAVTPPTTGEDLRLSYLLFVDSAPADPTREDARHATHIWITVER